MSSDEHARISDGEKEADSQTDRGKGAATGDTMWNGGAGGCVISNMRGLRARACRAVRVDYQHRFNPHPTTPSFQYFSERREGK